MKKNLQRSCLLLATLLLAATAAPAQAAKPAKEIGEGDLVRAIHNSWQHDPGDYVALNDAVTAIGGKPIKVSFPKAQKSGLTASEAQQEVDTVVLRALPLDIFNVSAVFSGSAGGNSTYLTYTGLWNFRDDFAGGDAPDDISAVAVDYPSCWNPAGDYANAWDYAGQDYSSKIYRKSAGSKTSIWGVRDQVSGFKIPTDHGAHTIQIMSQVPCRYQDFGGSYNYEHNQGGSATWSASVGLGFLNVSYNGSPGDVLQKGTAYELWR